MRFRIIAGLMLSLATGVAGMWLIRHAHQLADRQSEARSRFVELAAQSAGIGLLGLMQVIAVVGVVYPLYQRRKIDRIFFVLCGTVAAVGLFSATVFTVGGFLLH